MLLLHLVFFKCQQEKIILMPKWHMIGWGSPPPFVPLAACCFSLFAIHLLLLILLRSHLTPMHVAFSWCGPPDSPFLGREAFSSRAMPEGGSYVTHSLDVFPHPKIFKLSVFIFTYYFLIWKAQISIFTCLYWLNGANWRSLFIIH